MKKLRILHVEDDVALAEMYATGLRMAGHEVVIADRGARAVALASSGRFDFLLVDVQLPDLSGLEVLEKLEHLRVRPALAAVLSSLEDEREQERARRLGVCQWLVKSRTTPRALVAAIEQQVGSGRRSRRRRGEHEETRETVSTGRARLSPSPPASPSPPGRFDTPNRTHPDTPSWTHPRASMMAGQR